MKHPIDQPPPPVSARPAANPPQNPNVGISAKTIDHPVLSRLMDEVRNERGVESRYDRVHNRHNRGR